jgi:membrane-associated phospholipid phosphatase
VSLSLGQQTFASRTVAIGACCVLLSGSVLLSGRRALAEPPPAAALAEPPPAEASDAKAAATDSPPPAAAPQPRKAPVSPLVPGYVPTLVSTNAPPPLIWKWARFSTGNYLVTSAGAALTLAAAIIQPRAQHSLSGGVWFDESVRDALRVDTLPNRYIFRDASDVGLSLMVSWPFVADALTTAWWYRGSRDAAQEMALIDLETLAVSGAIQGVTNVMVSRERPFGRNCGTEELPSDSIDCANSVHYRSFFSGHSSFSFTSAALICVHHFKNELLGAPWDALSCAGGYALATTTATFRVVSDVHYASDVLTGALMGTLVGYGVPLLHYSRLGSSTTTMAGMQLHLVPSPGGLGVLGIF